VLAGREQKQFIHRSGFFMKARSPVGVGHTSVFSKRFYVEEKSNRSETEGSAHQPINHRSAQPVWFRILSRFEAIPHEPFSFAWWWDKLVVFTVFAITGSATMYFVRPLLGSVFGLEGSFLEGPWSYRLAYVLLITPTYTAMLLAVGTLFGRRAFFLQSIKRIWGRLLPFKK